MNLRFPRFPHTRAAAAVSALVLLAAPAPAQSPGGPVPLSVVERKLLPGAYVDSLEGAQWAAAEGARAVPSLERMLLRAPSYAERAETSAFPFNAVWALGRIPGPRSAAALGRVRAAAKDPGLRTMVGHALAAHRLRAQKGAACGVFGRGSLPQLYAEASTASRVLQTLPQGQAVRVLRENVVNEKEEGPRGGPTEFDRVSLLPSGRTGYVQRVGDLFPSFY